MPNRLAIVCGILPFAICLSGVATANDAGRRPSDPPERVRWMNDYAKARAQAVTNKQMLLVYFRDPQDNPACQVFEGQTLADPAVRNLVRQYVRVQCPLDATITVGGHPIELLRHGSFQAMNGRAGLAVVDFRDAELACYEQTVGCLPFQPEAYYAAPYHEPQSVGTFLALPPGTLTQRMMIYAVRMHPERPASAEGVPRNELFRASRRHSEHQADIRRQGHHNWEARFHEIWQRVGGRHPVEVCAESWPNSGLLNACLDCVHSWRHSSGHWAAVAARQPGFGYDIARGSNGIWYATGIFGGKAEDVAVSTGGGAAARGG